MNETEVYRMVFRLTCARLKAERLLLLFALVLLIAYISFCASDIRAFTDLYSYNQFDYRYHKNMNAYSESGFADMEVDPISVAIANGVDPRDLPETADLHDVYEAVIRGTRGGIYDRIFGQVTVMQDGKSDMLHFLLIQIEERNNSILDRKSVV